MKKLIQNTKKLIKGAPTAVVVSILFHAGLFLLAGMLVIFTIVKPKEIAFEPPPPVKVPKMPLKKLQVKMKKPSKPKSTAKITAVVNRPDLHDIQFPDLASSGVGAGLSSGGEVVQFAEMPSFDDEDGLLGKEKSIGNDLEGTYYDVKRTRSGNYRPIDGTDYQTILNKFFANWDTTTLSRYYRSPQKRYASSVVVNTMSSSIAPSAFGEDRASGKYWMVLYTGQIVYPEDITFRFWGVGDHFIGVRVNGEVKFFAAWQYDVASFTTINWSGNNSQKDRYFFGYDTLLGIGEWITLKAGVPQDIEIAMGDNGGLAALALLVEVKGEDYPLNDQGGPILPIFKTAEPSHDLMDLIYKDLYVGDCCLTNGPVFKDF